MHRWMLVVAMAVAASAQPRTPILSQDEIRKLETQVAERPADLKSQAVLAKNYAYVVLGVTALGPHGQIAKVDDLLAGGELAKHVRERLSSSQEPVVLGEAANVLWQLGGPFPRTGDARELAVHLLDRAVALDPGNHKWRSYRIPILVSRSNFQFDMPLTVAEAYAQVKADLAVLRGEDREQMLGYAAKLAVRASALGDADSYARDLLSSAAERDNWYRGGALFDGNLVLGQVALRKGEKEKAGAYLLAAGKTSGSPVLDSFGPNMSLAKELAEAGERKPVVEFLGLCKSFWKLEGGRLDRWSAEVAAGKVPDFGANLIY